MACDPETKPDPVSVTTRSEFPTGVHGDRGATAVFGATLASVGAGADDAGVAVGAGPEYTPPVGLTVKVFEALLPPAGDGLTTVTFCAAGDSRSAAGMTAVNSVGETYVVAIVPPAY